MAAICRRASEPQQGSLWPARTRPAIIPATMAAEEEPRPRAKGMRESMVYFRRGTGLLAAWKAALRPTTT